MAKWTKQDRLIGIVSAVIVLVGLVLFVVAVATPVGFGWFAYTPLSGQVFTSSDVVVLSRTAVLGAVLALIGLVGVAFIAGRIVGARRGRNGSEDVET